jgi:hypothetical protein
VPFFHQVRQPIEHLSEDFPDVADYLRSTFANAPVTSGTAIERQPEPSQHQQNIASETLTSSLIASVRDIMQRAEAENRDPDEELREAVGRHVLEGVATGFEMTTDEVAGGSGSDARPEREYDGVNGVKRPRRDA